MRPSVSRTATPSPRHGFVGRSCVAVRSRTSAPSRRHGSAAGYRLPRADDPPGSGHGSIVRSSRRRSSRRCARPPGSSSARFHRRPWRRWHRTNAGRSPRSDGHDARSKGAGIVGSFWRGVPLDGDVGGRIRRLDPACNEHQLAVARYLISNAPSVATASRKAWLRFSRRSLKNEGRSRGGASGNRRGRNSQRKGPAGGA